MHNHSGPSAHVALTEKEIETHTQAKKNLEDLNLSPMNQNMRLDEVPPPRTSQKKIMWIVACVGSFFVWACLTPIQEIASAAGQVIPSGFVKVIQHLEGGIVKELFVKDGDVVAYGDLLLTLDDISVKSELDQARIRQKTLKLQKERLQAFAESRAPNFYEDPDPSIEQIRNTQRSIYRIQLKSLKDQVTIINQQLLQKKSTLAVQKGRVLDLKRQVSLSKEIRDMYRGLAEKKLQSRSVFLQAEGNLAKLDTDYNQENNQIQETLDAISELESRAIEIKSRLIHDALKEMGDVSAEIARLNDEIIKLQDRVDRTRITSPADGIVKGLTITTLRGVIQAGSEIMDIVPQHSLEVEVDLNPQDVGNVRAGQHVKVKITAYDYARYGGLEGKIKSISATTFKDPQGKPFYKALISLENSYVGEDEGHNQISPGMTVQADIDTGKKTIFQYLFKPIVNAMETSFRER